LFAESENTFVSKMTGSKIVFAIGLGGQATSLTMHRAGREPTSAPRLP
jgi:hypothetical protein